MSAEVTKNKLMAISFRYLYEGMNVREDIYDYTGSVILLKGGVTLDARKLSQLKNFNKEKKNIYVMEGTYQELMKKHGLEGVYDQNDLERDMGYSDTKQDMNGFLNNVKVVSTISDGMTKRMHDSVKELLYKESLGDMLQCINAPRPVDEYLQRHSINVGMINGMIGKWLNFSEDKIEMLVLAGLMHDIGKTKVPDEILNAPRKLTFDEFEIMKLHPQYSYEVLDDTFDESVRLAARYHHEKTTGDGYPTKLNDDKIPVFARITAISDIYDAMVSKRSYKAAHSPLETLVAFQQGEFNGLDQEILDTFLHFMPSQYLNKSVLMSDGSVGTLHYFVPNDIAYPIIDVDGDLRQMTDEWKISRIVLE